MKEQDYLEELSRARENLRNFYKTQLIKCYTCGKKSQRQKWNLEEIVTTEEECGYPVHYRTYFEYIFVCPKCQKRFRYGNKKPDHWELYIFESKPAPEKKWPYI